jgi:exopolyphosphatase / guanosine-5'-triphosphate,3'-diphosphate pyrophosphatase
MRVAVVDLGTNSTRLLVADVEDGSVREVERRLAITRLGESVDSRRKLLPTAIARVRNVLGDYRREIEALGAERTLTLATSAVRDADNGEAFLGEIEWSYGFSTQLLSGEEEARMMFRGVASGLNGRNVDGTLLVDVGGGSTELVLAGAGGVEFHTSLDLGCVRLTERFLAGDPPTAEELAECRAAVRALLEERVPESVHATAGIGVAGTVTTLAALDLGLAEEDPELIHGHRLQAAWVEEELARLAALPEAELAETPGIHPSRAPVIVAGVVVVAEVLRHFGLAELEVSERDIMHGGALAAAELPEPEEGAAPAGAYTCC